LKQAKIYEELPVIYDHLMKSINYEIWAKYIFDIIKSYVNKDGLVLELGGGNCKFANYFVKYFPRLIVSDISENMLRADKKNLTAKVCCNMYNIPLKINFDLIYSNFDSVNYIMSKKKLLELFKEVSRVLNEDGVFTFDVSLEKNSIIHTKKPERSGIYKGITYNQKSEYNKKSRIHKNIFILKEKNKTVKEIHRQKIFPFETYFEVLDSAGLYVKHCYNAFSYNDGTSDSERIQFITKKVKRNAVI
jgi:ubiquinone/menaquinone biosynthesis C-methylase UbiE